MFLSLVRLEYLAWCDKLAVDDLRKVNRGRRWATIMNNIRIERLSERLEAVDVTPGEFLHQASWSIGAAVFHGLRLRRRENAQNADECASEDSMETSAEDFSQYDSDTSDDDGSDYSGEEDSDPDDDL